MAQDIKITSSVLSPNTIYCKGASLKYTFNPLSKTEPLTNSFTLAETQVSGFDNPRIIIKGYIDTNKMYTIDGSTYKKGSSESAISSTDGSQSTTMTTDLTIINKGIIEKVKINTTETIDATVSIKIGSDIVATKSVTSRTGIIDFDFYFSDYSKILSSGDSVSINITSTGNIKVKSSQSYSGTNISYSFETITDSDDADAFYWLNYRVFDDNDSISQPHLLKLAKNAYDGTEATSIYLTVVAGKNNEPLYATDTTTSTIKVAVENFSIGMDTTSSLAHFWVYQLTLVETA